MVIIISGEMDKGSGILGYISKMLGRFPKKEKPYVAFLDLNGPIFAGDDTTYLFCDHFREREYNGYRLFSPEDAEKLAKLKEELEAKQIGYTQFIPRVLDIYANNISRIPRPYATEMADEFIASGKIKLQNYAIEFLDALKDHAIMPVCLTSTPKLIIERANEKVLGKRLRDLITSTQEKPHISYNPEFRKRYGKRGRVYGGFKRRIDSINAKNDSCRRFVEQNKNKYSWIEYDLNDKKIRQAVIGAGDRINDMGFLEPYCFIPCVLNPDDAMYSAAKEAEARENQIPLGMKRIWIIFPDYQDLLTKVNSALSSLPQKEIKKMSVEERGRASTIQPY